jgi:Bacteriophage probable baseplate hub protein
MAAAASYPVRATAWVLTYAGVNITADVTGMVTEITYTSEEQHRTDEIEVRLEDGDRRWQGPWFPAYGSTVTLQIGYAGETLLPCGSFQIDEIELSGPPDTVHLKAIAAGVVPAIRTPSSAKYEGQTLAQIAATVAAKHGFTVVNAPGVAGLSFARRTQHHETDVQFLRRLANEYNYDFSIRGTQLIFFARTALETMPAVLTVQRTDVTKFELKGKSRRVYSAARVSYQNPATKTLITAKATDPDATTGDTLDIPERAESTTDAQARAAAALHRNNMSQETMNLTLPGTTKIVAGNNLVIQGFGGNDGTYLVTKARHKLERSSGYTTEAEGRKVS